MVFLDRGELCRCVVRDGEEERLTARSWKFRAESKSKLKLFYMKHGEGIFGGGGWAMERVVKLAHEDR